MGASQPQVPAPGALPPLRTLGDVRTALRSGHGRAGDRQAFEAHLNRALDESSETDLQKVADVITDYRGRILLGSDPEHEPAMDDAEALLERVKQEYA